MKIYIQLFFFSFVLSTMLYGQTIPMTINGSASYLNNDCYRLTDEADWQSGAIWSLDQIDLTENFTFSFDFFLGNTDGADGLAFLLQQNNTALGNPGGQMGYGGIAPSIALEFDTYYNFDYYDLNDDHLAFMRNGDVDHSGINNLAGPVPILGFGIDAEDGTYRNCRIEWNAATMTFNVFIECILSISYTGDIINNIFNGNPEVLYGFAASTGGLNNFHEICFSQPDSLSDPVQTICENDSILLSYDLNYTDYSWSPANLIEDPDAASTLAYPVVSTTFELTVTDSCENILVIEFPVLVESCTDTCILDLGPDQFLCEGESVVIDVFQDDANYLWQNGSTDSNITIDQSGLYYVTLSQTFCSITDSVLITFQPVPFVDLGPDQFLCEGESVVLDVFQDDANYLWQNGSTDSNLSIDQSGLYYVTLSQTTCSATDSILVTFQPLPDLELGPDQFLCEGESVVLDVNQNNADYLWQNGSTNSNIFIDQTGLYFVSVTQSNCSSADSVLITFQPLPFVDLGSDTTYCNTEVILSVPENNNSFLWNDGSNNNSLTVVRSGLYWIEVNQNGCINYDTINLEIIPAMQVPDLGNDQILCEGTFLDLDATTEFASKYLWSTGDSLANISVDQSSDYSVAISNTCETIVSESINLDYKYCNCIIEFPNIFTPNEDHINDYFYPNLNCIVNSYELNVYNFWGERVFNTNDIYDKWDGTYKGKILNGGVYIYVLQANVIDDNKSKNININGNVTLMK